MAESAMAPFDTLMRDETRYGRKVKKEDYRQHGKFPIIDQGQSEIAGYTDCADGIYSNVPALIFGDHTRIIKYVDTPFFLGADGVKLLKCVRSDVDCRYLYHFFQARPVQNTGYNRHFKWLRELQIPLPSQAEQKKIATQLDTVANLIRLRKQQLEELDLLVKSRFAEMFGDPLTNPHGWAITPLSEIIINANNGMSRRGNNTTGDIVLRLVELQEGYIDYTNPNRILLTNAEKERYRLEENDFLFARVNGNPDYVGRCAVFNNINEPVYYNDHIIRVHFDEYKLNGFFASALLNSSYGKNQMRKHIKTSAGQYTISQTGLGAIMTILPPIKMQEAFSVFLDNATQSKLIILEGISALEHFRQTLLHRYFKENQNGT